MIQLREIVSICFNETNQIYLTFQNNSPDKAVGRQPVIQYSDTEVTIGILGVHGGNLSEF